MAGFHRRLQKISIRSTLHLSFPTSHFSNRMNYVLRHYTKHGYVLYNGLCRTVNVFFSGSSRLLRHPLIPKG